jgi:hypothetical protein
MNLRRRGGLCPSQLTEVGRMRRGKIKAPEGRRFFCDEWAIVDSNHGPPPYQSGALTD